MRRHSFIILFALTALSFSDKSSSKAFSAGRSLIDVAPQQSPRIKSICNHDLCINKELKSISELQMSSITGGAQDEPVPLSTKIKKFTQKNTFLFGMAAAVMFAKAFPSLGVNGGIMRPELFIGKFGVTCIFLLSGVSLELSELKSALANFKLNFLVQAGSFLVWPFLVGVPLTNAIKRFLPNLFPKALLEGILILTCLPTTVNMCVLLTGAADGNVAASLANAVMGNMMGIFTTPALLMYFFGTAIELPFLNMVLKLCNKVLVPVAVGQVLRATPAKKIFVENKKTFKSIQEFILIGLVWNAFCNAFTKGLGIEFSHGVYLLGLLTTLHLGSFKLLMKFFSSKTLNFSRKDAIAATFCTSHKTLAFGLPLLNTIFEGNPNLAAYCAPVMFIHPLQLLLGSVLASKLKEENE